MGYVGYSQSERPAVIDLDKPNYYWIFQADSIIVRAIDADSITALVGRIDTIYFSNMFGDSITATWGYFDSLRVRYQTVDSITVRPFMEVDIMSAHDSATILIQSPIQCDTIRTEYIVLRDATGADSLVIFDMGSLVQIYADDPIILEYFRYLAGESGAMIENDTDTLSLTETVIELYGHVLITENLRIDGDTLVINDATRADSILIYDSGALAIIETDNPVQITNAAEVVGAFSAQGILTDSVYAYSGDKVHIADTLELANILLFEDGGATIENSTTATNLNITEDTVTISNILDVTTNAVIPDLYTERGYIDTIPDYIIFGDSLRTTLTGSLPVYTDAIGRLVTASASAFGDSLNVCHDTIKISVVDACSNLSIVSDTCEHSADVSIGDDILLKNGGTIDNDAAGRITITEDTTDFTGAIRFKDPGTSANSKELVFISDNAGTAQRSTIQMIYGADPYLRFSVDDDAATPSLKTVLDMKDQGLYFTDNTTDIGANGANRPKDLYLAGDASVVDNVTAEDIVASDTIQAGTFYDGTITIYNGDITGVDNLSADSIYADTATVNSMLYLTNDSIIGNGDSIAISQVVEMEDTVATIATKYDVDTLAASVYILDTGYVHTTGNDTIWGVSTWKGSDYAININDGGQIYLETITGLISTWLPGSVEFVTMTKAASLDTTRLKFTNTTGQLELVPNLSNTNNYIYIPDSSGTVALQEYTMKPDDFADSLNNCHAIKASTISECTAGAGVAVTADTLKQNGDLQVTENIVVGEDIVLPAIAAGGTTGAIYKGTSRYLYSFLPTGLTGTNYFFGTGAGNTTMSGTGVQAQSNIGIGDFSLAALTTGNRNVAIGYMALDVNTSGFRNTAVGENALGSNTISSANTAIGAMSLNVNTGANNTAVGKESGARNSTGGNNCYFGEEAGCWQTSGSSNTFIGYYSAYGLTPGNASTGNSTLGASSLSAIITGSYNLALGYQAGDNITTGSYNLIMGYDVDAFAVDANYQLIVGSATSGLYGYYATSTTGAGGNLSSKAQSALVGGTNLGGGDNLIISGNTTGNGGSEVIIQAVTANQGTGTDTRTPTTIATFYGNYADVDGYLVADSAAIPAVYGDTARFLSYVGHSDFTIGNSISGVTSMVFADGTTQSTGVTTADSVWSSATLGRNTIASGQLNFVASDNDLGNIAINTSDQLTFNNFAGGYVFDADIKTDHYLNTEVNTFLGISAGSPTLSHTTGSSGYNNTSVGYASANSLTTGYLNECYGYDAGNSITDGNSNTLIGGYAGFGITSGISTVCLGRDAGRKQNDGSTDLQTPETSVYIGRDTKSGSNPAGGEDVIVNENVFGYNATGGGANTVSLGDANITNTYLKGILNLTNGATFDNNTDANIINITEDTINVTGALQVTGPVTATSYYIKSTTATITAGTTQSQGQVPLVSDVNEVSVCANANDVVTLPSAVAGMEIFIINNGANTLQIFPASGDDLGAGVDTSTTLVAGSNVTFVSYNATNWEVK